MDVNQILYGGQSWKTPDYDKKNGEVFTREITEEDLKKFDGIETYKKPVRFSFTDNIR